MPRLVAIANADDPRLDAYARIRERDLAGREKRFIIEGEVVLRVAIEAGRYPIESCLIAGSQAGKLEQLLAKLPAETPVMIAPREVMDSVAGFPIHRGVLAAGLRTAELDQKPLADWFPPSALVVVAIGIANHDNIGGIFRNAAAFGADAVLLDQTCCDPLYRKAIRVSAGGALRVPFFRGADGAGLIGLLKHEGFAFAALSPSARKTMSDCRPRHRNALVVGAEGPGLPEEVLRLCECYGIRMRGGFDSLNVATATGIALNHMRNGR